jgi:hypothetical protein
MLIAVMISFGGESIQADAMKMVPDLDHAEATWKQNRRVISQIRRGYSLRGH